LRGALAGGEALLERDRAVALGEPAAIRAEDQRDVYVARDRKPEQLGKQHLSGRRFEEVIAADDLADAPIGIIDDDREVVCRNVVAAPEDEVVDRPGLRAVQTVREGHRRRARVKAPRARRRRTPARRTLALRKRATGAAVGATTIADVRRGRGEPHLRPCTPAGVRAACAAQLFGGLAVALPARALADDLPVPVEADRAQLAQLGALVLGTGALWVEILDPQQEAPPVRACEEPGDQRRTEVAEVQWSARTRCITAVVLAHRARMAAAVRRGRYSRLVLDPDSLAAHTDRLYRAAWALCGSPHDAEDLVQETFARVLARPRILRGENELAYLMHALRNTFLSDRRKAARRPSIVATAIEDLPLEASDPRTAPEAALAASEVLAAVAQLEESFRLALIAVDIVGLSYAEAARALGTREATITTRLYRARQRLARQLAPTDREGTTPAVRLRDE
jgi:RNA polymerase sigma-70 factor (ECF subfamily)